MVAFDPLQALLMRQATSRRLSVDGNLGSQIIRQAATPTPVYSPGAALARALTGGAGGLISQWDDQEERQRDEALFERANALQQKSQSREQAEADAFLHRFGLGGAPAPSNEKAPEQAPFGLALSAQAPGATHPVTGRPILQNPDGSVSTERSITVTDPRLNNGQPTNIPSIWGGRELSQDEAIAQAARSGQPFAAFPSIDAAVAAARARSNELGATLGQAVPPSAPGAPQAPPVPPPPPSMPPPGQAPPAPQPGAAAAPPAPGAPPNLAGLTTDNLRSIMMASSISQNPRVQQLGQWARAEIERQDRVRQEQRAEERHRQSLAAAGAGTWSTVERNGRTFQINSRSGQVREVALPSAEPGGPTFGSGFDAQATVALQQLSEPIRNGTATPQQVATYLSALNHLQQEKVDVHGNRIIPRLPAYAPPEDFVVQRYGVSRVPPTPPTEQSGQGGQTPPPGSTVAEPPPQVAPPPAGQTNVPAPQTSAPPPPAEVGRPAAGGLVRGRETPLTEAQSKDNVFGLGMQRGDAIIRELGVPSDAALLALRNLPESVVNFALNENDQKFYNAMREFGAAALRKETGAAFQPYEVRDLQTRYFPMAGDSPAVLAQKAENRRQRIAAMEAAIPGGFRAGAAATAPVVPQVPPPARPTSEAEFNALPSGTRFIGPDGVERQKP